MKAALYLSVLASAAVGLVAAEELKVDVTHAVKCDRKTQNGDKIAMHYKGTLADSGKKFDASTFKHLSEEIRLSLCEDAHLRDGIADVENRLR